MTSDYGPRQRELLQGRAARTYREIVDAGSLAADDPRFAADHPERASVELLVDLGLLALDPLLDAYVPVDPATVQSRVVAPMGQRATDLLTESTAWATVFAELGQVFRHTSPGASPVLELRGYANINRFIQTAVGDAQKELLTAQPAGARSAATLEVAVERDIRALSRGVAMRTLYQHSARRSTATREYVERVSAHGAEVRTLDEFFNRLIVVDGSLAIVPGAEGTHVAVAIHDRSLVAYLVDNFERHWERAHDFSDRNLDTARDIADDVHNMTVRMLVEGHSDNASAKRMGVSARTFAGYVAALKEEYGAETRFQLGYAMGQQEAREGRRRGRKGVRGGSGAKKD
ncbi:MAG TPA: LuxR family transcriptional regulator [Marmoricola sp.]